MTRGDGATRSTYRGPWRIDVTVRNGIPMPVPKVALVQAVVAAAEAAGAPSPASIGLILTDDEELATLNAAHLGKSGPTDVLSFPLLTSAAFPPQQGGLARGASAATMAVTGPSPGFSLPPGRRPHLGDIVISVERAIDQAEAGRGGQTGDVRWSPAAELRLLATHGALHLCGWDHAEPADELSMRALEARLLGPLG